MNNKVNHHSDSNHCFERAIVNMSISVLPSLREPRLNYIMFHITIDSQQSVAWRKGNE
jgi:hypothetical protein